MAKKNVQVRMDEKELQRVEHIFDNLGVDVPTAVRVFFKKVVIAGGFPFDVREDSYHHYTPEEMAEIEKAYEESLDPKNLSRSYNLPKETDALFKDLGLPS